MPTEPTIIFDKDISFRRRDNANVLYCSLQLNVRGTTEGATDAARISKAEIDYTLLRDREGGEPAADTKQRVVNRAKARFQDYIDVRGSEPAKFSVHWEVFNDAPKRWCLVDSTRNGASIFSDEYLRLGGRLINSDTIFSLRRI